ncbi:MAG: RelA/SpoT domain-containing protein [Acidiferrobacter sp.]
MDFDGYEHVGQAAYAAFATTVAAILKAAIGAGEGYRLQQVVERAKQPAALRRKLEQRGIAPTATLADNIKDLAGCRVIFYTNSDVTRFINSGMIHENFEVLESKLHYPRRAAEDAAELYMSDHYLVRLRPERLALPEYGRFAGMRCEVQIQTILNHAWAEMAHDTIYKTPQLGDFGGRAFDGIKNRMQKVARKYLLPAGYEFQKIASDFQRLIEGKALFDGDALDAIVEAANNNVRAQAIETFAENVLPLHDDLQTVYPEVVARLVAAADRARATPPAAIETPYGTLSGKDYSDILKAIADLLTRYRYLDVDTTFDALRTLYGWAATEAERKPLLDLGKALAKHQLYVWRQYGPIVQRLLVQNIEALGADERRSLAPLLVTMLDEILGTEISGTTNSSTAVTFHGGVVVVSEALRILRTKAIDLLKCQFTLAESDEERRAVLRALHAAARHPIRGGYSNALARVVMEDTRTIMEFQAGIVPALSHDLLQSTEHWVHRHYWMYADLPETMRDEPDLVAGRAQVRAAALAFRDRANSDPDFVIHKTLVGFESVFPSAWEDKDFGYEQANTYRAGRVDELVASVEAANADIWFDRITRYARTESDDVATFPVFGRFLELLAVAQPAIVLGYIDRIEEPLANFLPAMLAGLMKSSEREQTLTNIEAWLRAGAYIGHIAWHLRLADPFDEGLLRRTLDRAIELGDGHAMRNVLIAAVTQFAAHPGTLIEEVFLPALRTLAVAQDFSWVHMSWFSWLGSPILRALDEEQASVVLDALVPYPDLEYNAEYIAAAIAERWPASVVAFIAKRQNFARTDAVPLHYDAVPFRVHQLQSPLAAVPDIMLDGARTWFNTNPQYFTDEGGRLLASVFPDLSNGMEVRLTTLIKDGGNAQDLAFVLGVLAAFEGKPCVYALVRAIVAVADPGTQLLEKARSVLRKTGVVSGEFGFVEIYTERKVLLDPWLSDPNERVRLFAAERIRELDQSIAAESRSAEASIALRKLEYGEELDGGEES